MHLTRITIYIWVWPGIIDVHPVKTAMPQYKKEGIETAKIGVVLPKEVKAVLEQVAKSKQWSISQTAATAIEEWLEKAENNVSADEESAAWASG